MYNVYFYTLYTHCHKPQKLFHTFVCLLKEIGKPVTFTIILFRKKNYLHAHAQDALISHKLQRVKLLIYITLFGFTKKREPRLEHLTSLNITYVYFMILRGELCIQRVITILTEIFHGSIAGLIYVYFPRYCR